MLAIDTYSSPTSVLNAEPKVHNVLSQAFALAFLPLQRDKFIPSIPRIVLSPHLVCRSHTSGVDISGSGRKPDVAFHAVESLCFTLQPYR